MATKRLLLGVLSTMAIATASPAGAFAHEAPNASVCNVRDVEYAVSANLRVTGTIMGAGDGDYTIGPGKIVLHFDDRAAQGGAGSNVTMVSYEMLQHFLVVSKALFWTTKVMTDVHSEGTPGASAGVAQGAYSERSIRWMNVAKSFRSDGSLTCDGSLCGMFGAPQPGRSELHMGPSTMTFKPFQFSPDMTTFSMQPVLTSKTSSPQQESYVALSGRETRRTCLDVR
jgi:hypothetical protein